MAAMHRFTTHRPTGRLQHEHQQEEDEEDDNDQYEYDDGVTDLVEDPAPSLRHAHPSKQHPPPSAFRRRSSKNSHASTSSSSSSSLLVGAQESWILFGPTKGHSTPQSTTTTVHAIRSSTQSGDGDRGGAVAAPSKDAQEDDNQDGQQVELGVHYGKEQGSRYADVEVGATEVVHNQSCTPEQPPPESGARDVNHAGTPSSTVDDILDHDPEDDDPENSMMSSTPSATSYITIRGEGSVYYKNETEDISVDASAEEASPSLPPPEIDSWDLNLIPGEAPHHHARGDRAPLATELGAAGDGDGHGRMQSSETEQEMLWTSVPTHDSSYFFDDDPADLDGTALDEYGQHDADDYPDSLFTDQPRHGDDRHAQAHSQRHLDREHESYGAPSIYASLPNVRLSAIQVGHRGRLRFPANAPNSARMTATTATPTDDEDTDMLSLPSSLSVSERTHSNSTRSSPRFSGSYGEAHSRPLPEGSLEGIENTGLTHAALSRIDEASAIHGVFDLGQAAHEAGLTSGSEEDEDGDNTDTMEDPEERLLAKAPDAISAGIRPIRNRPALQALPPTTTSQRTVSAGRVSESIRDNLSVTSSAKRRHRRAGTNDRGIKRSNKGEYGGPGRTVAEVESVSLASAKSGHPASAARRPVEQHARSSTRHRNRDAVSKVFDLDNDILAMMSQPGSIMGQSIPPTSSVRPQQHEYSHGFHAFSAHMASELGDTQGISHLFGAADDHVGPQSDAEESDNDTKTVQSGSSLHHHNGHRSHHRIPRHHRGQRSSQEAGTGGTMQDSRTTSDEECIHTASLGLHRSLTLASLQHFLVESIYGSLPSSLLGTPSLSSSRTDMDLEPVSGGGARRRTISTPHRHTLHGRKSSLSSSTSTLGQTVERSHSSSDLRQRPLRSPSGSSEGGRGATAADYTETLSYWRRILRSLAY